jgi:hypothetical protein
MTGLREEMDWFERRALELEVEQRHRFELGGSHREFWSSRYEQMQLFLIRRYRDSSKTWFEFTLSSQGLQGL